MHHAVNVHILLCNFRDYCSVRFLEMDLLGPDFSFPSLQALCGLRYFGSLGPCFYLHSVSTQMSVIWNHTLSLSACSKAPIP
jgi:hypothetical protein